MNTTAQSSVVRIIIRRSLFFTCLILALSLIPVLRSGAAGRFTASSNAPESTSVQHNGTGDDAQTRRDALSPLLSSRYTTSRLAVPPSVQPHDILISEFRLRGPNGADDEYLEFYNNSRSALTVSTTDASAGWALVASDGIARFVIPNGTVIPAYGHYLATNSVGYGLVGYATPDITFATDIPDNAGMALFNSSTTFTLANRLDAAGFTPAPALYREGAGFNTLVPFSIDASFYRDLRPAGFPLDRDDNVTDFIYVDTNGTFNGGQQNLGAPGPKNLASPIHNRTGSMPSRRIDPSVSTGAAPNFVYDPTSDPGNNSSFGTITVRRTFTNNTGAPITQLRFRYSDINTFPSPPNVADLRPRNSAGGSVAIAGANPACPGNVCAVDVTTLEQPPSQFNGGGFNSSVAANTVTLGVPLADGASINLDFRNGIEQSGCYRFQLVVEALPSGVSTMIGFTGSAGTAGACPGDPATRQIAPLRPLVDFDGDGGSDYAVIRDSGSAPPAKAGALATDGPLPTRSTKSSGMAGANASGRGGAVGGLHRGYYFKLPGERFDPLAPRLARPSGVINQLLWVIHPSGGGADLSILFGTLNDFPVPADYDGDGICDLAVWTGGVGAQFRVLTSASGFVTTVTYTLGNASSDPSVVGDYDGDGKADPAIENSNTGQFTYLGGPTHATLVTVTPVGTFGGGFPIPGDYDGDGTFDFMLETRDGINPTQGHFYQWINDGTTTPPATNNFVFGNYRDVAIPGDYDGDGTTDVGLASIMVNPIAWRIRLSDGFGTLIGPVMFGNPSTDYTLTGDYNNDQMGEMTIWHSPGQFQSLLAPAYTLPSTDFAWGASGDYPVAYFNSH
ncbi:MAG: hypothetical protein ABIP75_18520 [Pyrinomonadaceae bacterium]